MHLDHYCHLSGSFVLKAEVMWARRARQLIEAAPLLPPDGGRVCDWARAAGWCSCDLGDVGHNGSIHRAMMWQHEQLDDEITCVPEVGRTRRALRRLYRLGLVDLVGGRWVPQRVGVAMSLPLRRAPSRAAPEPAGVWALVSPVEPTPVEPSPAAARDTSREALSDVSPRTSADTTEAASADPSLRALRDTSPPGGSDRSAVEDGFRTVWISELPGPREAVEDVEAPLLIEHLDGPDAWAEVYGPAPGPFERRPHWGAYVVRMTRDREFVRAYGLEPKIIRGRPGPVSLTIEGAILGAATRYGRWVRARG